MKWTKPDSGSTDGKSRSGCQCPFLLCELFDSSPDKIKSVVIQVIASYTETKPSKDTYFASLRKTKVPAVSTIPRTTEGSPGVCSNIGFCLVDSVSYRC